MPPRLTAHDFDQELLNHFDAYVHGAIDRRSFLERAQKFATVGMSATGLLAALSPDFARGQQVAASDPRLRSERLSYPSPAGTGTTAGYLVRPAGIATRLPAVLVIHENRGLNPHIEDVARRLALEGFMVFAPDGLSPVGGYGGDEDKASAAFAALDKTKMGEDFVAAALWLRNRADCTGKLGAVGFCYGGGVLHMLSTRVPDLNAAVAYYGRAPEPQDAAKVHASLLVHLAETDPRVNNAWPAYEAALKAAGAGFVVHQYAGTQHAFNNDAGPRYDASAAKLAWERTIAFFKAQLQG